MYNTGIFSELYWWEWDLDTGKWDLERKNGLGNGIGTPPPPFQDPHVLFTILEGNMRVKRRV